jgi:hypothetical protein
MAQDAFASLHHLHGHWKICTVFADDQFADVGVLKRLDFFS